MQGNDDIIIFNDNEVNKQEKLISLNNKEFSIKKEYCRSVLYYNSMGLVLFMFFIFLLCYMPIFTINYYKIKYEFKNNNYYLIFILLILSLLFISLICFVYKMNLVKKKLIYYIFCLYLTCILGVISVIGLYDIKLTFAINSEITIMLLILWILQNISSIKKMIYIKLLIIYGIIFIGMIVFIVLSDKYFVEYFVFCIYSTLLLSFLCVESKYSYEDFYINDEAINNINIRMHLISFMSIHIDIMTCTFK